MASITWPVYLILIISFTTGQRIGSDPYSEKEICRSVSAMSIKALQKLTNCVVIVGNLRILLLEKITRNDFKNVSFPKLREVTGYMLIYRVAALESVGELFPNLARIRGEEVFGNYGLIVHDLQNLVEVGLYGLLKIDRGGVIIWGGPQTCFEDTIDWKTIAPRHRHVLIPSIRPAHCNVSCRCSLNTATNHCWNNWKCQRYITGPDAEECHEQCFGCRKTNPDECSLCRNYTHRRQCVATCPAGTLVLEENKYCLTEAECHRLYGFPWDGSCVFRCPIDFKAVRKKGDITCVPCNNCSKTCSTQKIYTMRDIKAADRCTYIEGSLIIHLRSLQEDEMGEFRLNEYLSRIEEVSDYVEIYGSNSITSLEFLTSLKRIRGQNLKEKKYSLLITDMQNLQSLFATNVTNNLQVDNGTLGIYGNPMLCVSEIEKIKPRFPIKPNVIDIPEQMNGYSASGCEEVAVGLQIRVRNETSAYAMFSPDDNQSLHYTILYVRLPPNAHTMAVPESCSELEWFAITAEYRLGHINAVELNSLRPASTYAICVESYDPVRMLLARSPIANFTMPVGKPAPPFISELVASADGVVVIRWADHKDYKIHITHYELYVNLVDFDPTIDKARNHCNDTINHTDNNIDDSRHSVVMKPPPEYNKICESLCGELSSDTKGAMIRENFDLCSSIDSFEGCDNEEDIPKLNNTSSEYVKTLFMEIKGPKEEFQVGGLAPYHDYRFRLRACTKSNCSRSARGLVRTFPSKNADLVTISSAKANEIGELSVQWQPPDITNGPVLSYSVQVFPVRRFSDLGTPMLQEWCASNDQHHLSLRSEKTNKYNVRVCLTSLATTTCSEWETVTTFQETAPKWMWVSGITSGILLCVVSSIAAKLWKPLRHNDRMLLIDETSMYRGESEPVTFMMTEFAPIYSIPFSDTNT